MNDKIKKELNREPATSVDLSLEAFWFQLLARIPNRTRMQIALGTDFERTEILVKASYKQGAEEERDRLAKIFEGMPADDLSPAGVARTIRSFSQEKSK